MERDGDGGGGQGTNEERNLYSLSSWNGVRKEVKEEEEGRGRRGPAE